MTTITGQRVVLLVNRIHMTWGGTKIETSMRLIKAYFGYREAVLCLATAFHS